MQILGAAEECPAITGTADEQLSALMTPEVPIIVGAAGDETRVEPGKSCEVRTLYGMRRGSDWNWVEKPPPQLPANAKADFEAPAIRVYKVQDESFMLAGLSSLVVHKIEIRSPYILSQLAPILADYGEVLAGKKMATFMPPFKPLYFGYTRILDLHKTVQGSVVDNHLRLLVDLMVELLGETVTEISRLLDSGVMSYWHLWTLFPNGILVYAMHRGVPQLYKVRGARYAGLNSEYLEIQCQFVQHDGACFGFTTQNLHIMKFGGHMRIANLAVYPLGYHNDKKVHERLIERGKQVLDFQTVMYRSYTGVAWDEQDEKKYYVGTEPFSNLACRH